MKMAVSPPFTSRQGASPVIPQLAVSALESLDGKFVYYSRDGNIWRKPVSGGEQELLVNGLSGWSDFAVVEQGIFFVARANPGKRQSIRFYRFSTGQIHAVTDLAKPIFAGLTASADGRSILYSQVDRNESDLMLVDLPR